MKTRKFVRVGNKGVACVDPAAVTTLYAKTPDDGSVSTLIVGPAGPEAAVEAYEWDMERTASVLGIELVDSIEDSDLKAAAVAAVDALLDYEQGINNDTQRKVRIALSRALWGMVKGED